MSDSAINAILPYWEESDLAIVCGVSNAGGGTIVVKAADRRGRREQRHFRKTFETIPALCLHELGLSCMTEPVMDGMDLCLEITVPAAEEPISYLGNYYLYSNGANHPISGEEIERLYDKNANTAWESRLQPFVREDDLDSETMTKVANIVEEELGDNAPSIRSINKLLQNYGVKSAQNNAFTNMGVLLMHNAPDSFIPGAVIHIGLFHENGAKAGMAEVVTGPLLTQLRKTSNILFGRYLPAALELQDSIGRTPPQQGFPGNEPTLPPADAINEALLNALVHKDYESEMPIRVSVYPSKLYIDNVGRPPSTWTVSDLLGRHNSRPNNPMLARVLQHRHIFTGWGSGIGIMVAACTEAGLPAPEFNLRADEMDVCFRFRMEEPAGKETTPNVEATAPHTAPQSVNTPARTTAVPSGNAASANNADRKPTFKERSIAAANGLDMTSTDEYILKVIETNGRITAMRISEVLGVSESTVRRSFRRLREYGFIERIGSDKSGYWRLVD